MRFEGRRSLVLLSLAAKGAALVAGETADAEGTTGLEPDGKGLPILIKHYVRMNAKLLDFGVWKNHSNAVVGFLIAGLGTSVLFPQLYDRAARAPGPPGSGGSSPPGVSSFVSDSELASRRPLRSGVGGRASGVGAVSGFLDDEQAASAAATVSASTPAVPD